MTVLATHTVKISAVALEADPFQPGHSVLTVGGSLSGNIILIAPAPSQGHGQHEGDDGNHGGYVVTIDNVSQTYKPQKDDGQIDRIEVYTQAGTNNVTISNQIKLLTELFGGRGIDNLTGGGGSAILVGGSGTETLTGGQGRSLLIGGAGKANLIGGPADDILVGGDSAFVMNEAALLAVLAEWGSHDSYARRLAEISGTRADDDDAYFLNSSTVYDSTAHDVMTGNGGRDWFFAGLDDTVTDQAANETKS